LIHVCKVSTDFGEGHALFFASFAALVSHHACGAMGVTNERETGFPCETLWSSLKMAALWSKLSSFCVIIKIQFSLAGSA